MASTLVTHLQLGRKRGEEELGWAFQSSSETRSNNHTRNIAIGILIAALFCIAFLGSLVRRRRRVAVYRLAQQEQLRLQQLHQPSYPQPQMQGYPQNPYNPGWQPAPPYSPPVPPAFPSPQPWSPAQEPISVPSPIHQQQSTYQPPPGPPPAPQSPARYEPPPGPPPPGLAPPSSPASFPAPEAPLRAEVGYIPRQAPPDPLPPASTQDSAFGKPAATGPIDSQPPDGATPTSNTNHPPPPSGQPPPYTQA